ncbi:MAG: DNA-protecting protein DprA [Oscillospiraceae bacterium]|nr:DNA-protecting protein DprA [Oscillospiraceae bacterium]
MSRYLYWLCTALAGSKALGETLDRYGNAKAVYDAVECDIAMPAALKNRLKSTPFGADLPEGVSVVVKGSKDYPAALAKYDDSPRVLFYSGDLSLLEENAVGIVGTRYADDYGLAVTKMYAGHLADMGRVIAGGVALGVETTAFKEALSRGGCCIAVLPCGINRITPASNYALMEKIVAQGGLVLSALAPDVPVLQGAYHQRGRLMAMCMGSLLVTQCGVAGGVHITVGHVKNQGKTVYAVPARIGSEKTSGTNLLIKEGAAITTDPTDFGKINETKKHTPLTGDEKIIYDLICQGYTDSAVLMDVCGMLPQRTMQILSVLENGGYITYTSGGSYMPTV